MIQQHLFGQPQTELTSDDYYTPKWVFDTLDLEFDLDVASPPGGPPFVPCERYFTQEDDGLVQPWHGIVWMNPPYSDPKPWVDRWLDHGNGLALLPMAKGCRWLDDLWTSRARIVITRRIRFHRGHTTTEISFPSAFWAIGDRPVKALARLGKVR